MKHARVLSVTLATLAAVVAASAAHAVVVAPPPTLPPPAIAYVSCNDSAAALSCDAGTATGQVTFGPDASVQTYAFGEGLVDNAGAIGVLNYALEVTGGNPGDPVTLDIATNLTASPISIGYVFSEVIVSADTSAGMTICSNSCGAGDGLTSFNGILQVQATSGTLYAGEFEGVYLEAESGGALGNASDFNGGTAIADPHIYVDPGTPDAAAYSVFLSPGIGNGLIGSAVPEPAAWTLMLLGFAGLGATLRSRRARTVA